LPACRQAGFRIYTMITHSSLETEKLGEKLGEKIKKGAVIALYGELGSGKTTFVKGLARGLGIKKRIVSPTFIFIRIYKILSQKARAKETPPRWQAGAQAEAMTPRTVEELASARLFYHIDLYRINKAEDARGLGIEEILSDSKNIIVIEWAERIKKILPKKRIDVHFKYLDEKKRNIYF